MLNFIKKYKFILIFLLFVLFLLISTNVQATISSDYSSLSDTKKETIVKAWEKAVSLCESQSINIKETNYCVTYSDGSSSYASVYILNPSKNTLFELATSSGNKDWFNYGIFVDCKVGEEPVTRWNGYNNSTIIAGYYFAGSTNYVIANNVYTTNSSYKQISRSIEDVDFIDNPFNEVIPDFYVEYNEVTCSYFCYTQWHVLSDFNRYYYFYSENYQDSFNIHTYDTDGWTTMFYELEDENEELTDTSKWRYSQELIGYGEYYFCKWDLDLKKYNIYKIILTEDGESYISNYNQNTGEWETTEIIENVSFNNYNMYVVYDNYSAMIYSNYFSYADRYNYVITFSLDGINYNHDILTEQYGVDIKNDKPGYYRYFKEVIENRTYYFRLQIFDPENNAAIVDTQYFEVVVNGDFYLSDTTKDVAYYRNSSVYRILKDKLGILFYPIDITFEFFERLSEVQENEPIITIPDVQEPFTQKTLITGFTFNLKEVLQDNNILYIYNIYLMFIDFIVYIMLFNLLRKVFEEFFNVGGLFGG